MMNDLSQLSPRLRQPRGGERALRAARSKSLRPGGREPRLRRLAGAALLLLCGSLLAAVAPKPAPGEVVVVHLKSIIQPVVAEFLRDTIAEADERQAAALVIELNTPGGLLTSTRDITQAMLGARTPIVVYVGPSGAQAGSAGFFLLMAADVAAMAPGTNAGAAHPVGAQGEDIEGTMAKKVEEDAAAQIRSLAGRNGRSLDLAQKAVVESKSFTAEEALRGKLIEVIAPTLPALLQAIDGRTVQRGGTALTLRTAQAEVRTVELSPLNRFLGVLADPNIAFLLMSFGWLGLMFEITHPGAVLPGIMGGICLILAFFAFSVLPVNYAGVALIGLGALFFILEIKVTSHGALAMAGATCLVLGSLMLYKSPEPALRVSRQLIAALAFFSLAVVGFLSFMALRARRAPVRTGREGLLTEVGTARSALSPRGKVFVHGELWDAEAEEPVAAGSEVEIVAVERLRLRVRPHRPSATA
jgi:membrane-bound serine protease (ClpP class)